MTTEPISKESIRADLTAAMKARDAEVTGTLRMFLAAVGNAEVAGKEQVELTSDQIITILRSEVKKRNDSALLYEQGDRAELAAKERAEVEILSRYLPAEMSDETLNGIISEAVAAAAADGNVGPKAMGSVMKIVKERVGTTVDGGRVAAAVKAALA
jgi:uncharacterized protein